MSLDNVPAGQEQRRFTLFPALAPELRIKIWKYALPGPRYIEAKTCRRWDGFSAWDGTFYWQVLGKDKAPAVLFVCHESREASIKNYTLIRSTEDGCQAAYFNPNIDVLVFRYTDHQDPEVFEFEAFVNHLPDEFVARIKHMGWEAEEAQEDYYDHTQTNHFVIDADYHLIQTNLNKLRGLESLSISQYNEAQRGMVIGFKEHEPNSEHHTAREHVLGEITTSGKNLYKRDEELHADWVAPKIRFGEFVVEE
jgi:hypothetical protein